MKRNGFTLIELLAVIVVLAIIALIATPIVLNIINNAKTSSNERSGELYVKAVENAIMKKQMNGTDVVTSGTYIVQSDGSICIEENQACTDGTTISVDVEGDSPTEGTLTVSNGVVVSYNLVVSGTSIVKVDSSDEEDDNEDSNADIAKYYKCVRDGNTIYMTDIDNVFSIYHNSVNFNINKIDDMVSDSELQASVYEMSFADLAAGLSVELPLTNVWAKKDSEGAILVLKDSDYYLINAGVYPFTESSKSEYDAFMIEYNKYVE